MSKRSIIVLALIALLAVTAALAGPVVARELQFGRQVAAVRAGGGENQPRARPSRVAARLT